MDRNEVMVRPQAERSTYYQDAPPRIGTSSYQSREQRLPLMVRGTPPSQGLQDLLVPSIETGSSDALVESPRPELRREIYRGFDQESYPRRAVERRRQSPAGHQVIVINDNSPQAKRRRVIEEDDFYHFRPVPSHNERVYSIAPHADSPLMPASSLQPRNFHTQNPRTPCQSSQDLLRDTQQSLTGPSGERIPVYDAPVESGYLATTPSHFRRTEIGVSSGYQWEVPHTRGEMDFPRHLPDNVNENLYLRPPVAEDLRMVGRGQAVRLKEPDFGPMNQGQRSSSSSFPVPYRVSRSYEMNHDPVYTDQAFIHTFSQSRLGPPLPKARDGTNLPPERSHQNFVSQDNIPQRFEDQSARSFTTVRPAQARSPVQYVERPM
jgi:hypothetical protein